MATDATALVEKLKAAVEGASTDESSGADTPVAAKSPYEDFEAIAQLIDKRLRVDRLARAPFESEWFRNILFYVGEHWVSQRRGQWQRKKLPKWLPRTITNKVSEKVNDFVSVLMRGRVPIRYFPQTDSVEDKATANIEERLRDVIYEEAQVEHTEIEQATWVSTTGNAYRVTYYDNSPEHGEAPVQQFRCPQCQEVVGPKDAKEQTCPLCQFQGEGFTGAVDETNEPINVLYPIGRLSSDVCSPFEIRGDFTIPLVKDWRWYIRIRLYDREFAKTHWKLTDEDIANIGDPEPGSEESLTLYYLAALSRLTSSLFGTAKGWSVKESPKVLAYEFVELPTEKFPEGLRAVRLGPKKIVEATPNPYRIGAGPRKGKQFLNLSHTRAEIVPGRHWGKTRITDVIPLQQFRNVIESAIKITIHRAAGPSWLNPVGSNVSKFSGEPVQVIDYTPLALGGTTFAKPEMVAPQLQPLITLTAIIQRIDDAIERVTGTYFLQGGDAPPNISAASALALLDERAQRAVSPLIREWAKGWKEWEWQAIEIMREHAVDDRIRMIAGRNQKWAVEKFSKADLQGAVNIKVDYEGVLPRSNATQRATVIQLTQMGYVQPFDPETAQNVRELFGLATITGSSDLDWEDAAREFRDFIDHDEAPMVLPLVQNSTVHLQQHAKDAKGDEFRALRKENPAKAQQWLDHIKATAVDLQMMAQMNAQSAEMAKAAGLEGNDAAGGPSKGQAGAQAGSQRTNTSPLGQTPDILSPQTAEPAGTQPPPAPGEQ